MPHFFHLFIKQRKGGSKRNAFSRCIFQNLESPRTKLHLGAPVFIRNILKLKQALSVYTQMTHLKAYPNFTDQKLWIPNVSSVNSAIVMLMLYSWNFHREASLTVAWWWHLVLLKTVLDFWNARLSWD